MDLQTHLRPLDASQFGQPQASHLLARAGFGGTAAQAADLASMGLHGAVDYLVDYQSIPTDDSEPELDPDVIKPLTVEERRAFRMARSENGTDARRQIQERRNQQQRADRVQFAALRNWWLARMIETGRPLEEKLVLLWHGHFASSFRNVRDSYLMYQQNVTFREHAAGSFADLAHAIVRDPAMIAFLNNNRNNKTKPNENLARELMELFTLGEGNYTEDDIKQGARALTGYTYRDNDFTFAQRIHDEGDKTILGETGKLTGDDFVAILLKRPQCATFIAYKLYRHFVADVESDDVAAIGALAEVVKQNDYQIAPTIKTLLRSEHFYSSEIVGQKIKSPAQFTIGAIRSLNTPVREVNILNDAMSLMGQALFLPPSVAGWDGGRGWINTSSLFIRQNLTTYMLTGTLPTDTSRARQRDVYDPSFLVEGLTSRRPEAIVDHVLPQVMTAPVSKTSRAAVVEFLRDRGDVKRDTLLGLLLIVTTLPEYQLC